MNKLDDSWKVLNHKDLLSDDFIKDLVPVWAVLDFTHLRIVERELLLVKVSTVPKEQIEELEASEKEETDHVAAKGPVRIRIHNQL